MTRAYDAVVVEAQRVSALVPEGSFQHPGVRVAIILEPYTWADFAADPRVPNSILPSGTVAICGVPVVCGKP